MLDDHVAAVLKKIEELGKTENTLVIFMADHGVEPGKASCYEVGCESTHGGKMAGCYTTQFYTLNKILRC